MRKKPCNQEKKTWKAFNAPKHRRLTAWGHGIAGIVAFGEQGKPFASSPSPLLSDSHNI
jgi:hypothetical protein